MSDDERRQQDTIAHLNICINGLKAMAEKAERERDEVLEVDLRRELIAEKESAIRERNAGLAEVEPLKALCADFEGRVAELEQDLAHARAEADQGGWRDAPLGELVGYVFQRLKPEVELGMTRVDWQTRCVLNNEQQCLIITATTSPT